MMKIADIFKEKMTVKGKIVVSLLILVIVAIGGIVSFKFYDFTQNNPKFCISCHLMQPAYDAWAESKHSEINCHDCHHLSIAEQNRLLINFVLHRPEKVPERHGKTIVPWKYCVQCHWDTDERYPAATKINDSRGHAKHYFMEQIECAKCHGYRTHRFLAEERFCIKCHEGKEVHGTGMQSLACLNCHTDRTYDFRPDRAKCLYCHGDKKNQEQVLASGTIDVKYDLPTQDVIDAATKIVLTENSAMQFDCYTCHAPHGKVRPDWKGCLKCHENIPITGAHQMHIESMGLECNNCHKPHIWKVTKEQAKKDCTTCHEYRDPKRFLK